MRSMPRRMTDRVIRPFIRDSDLGDVLEVGVQNEPYKYSFNTRKTIDIDPKFSPDVVGDIQNTKLRKEQFDTIIAIELLEHVRSPKSAADEMHRLLKRKGRAILSTRFTNRYHPIPKDYYRFTRDSIRDIFSSFDDVRIIPTGTAFHSAVQALLSTKMKYIVYPLSVLLSYWMKKDFNFPLGYVIIAKKR